MTPALPNDTFDVILSDPPWHYFGSPTKWAAAAKFYSLMTDEQIAALPVGDILSKRGIVFMWTTSSALERSIACLNAWGVTYRGVAFVWVKTGKNGKPFGARGVRPSITKPLTEFVICGSRVAKGRPMPLASESVCQTIFAAVGEHSAKPPDVHDRIEQMYPGKKYLEMFARADRANWTLWGNQAPVRHEDAA